MFRALLLLLPTLTLSYVIHNAIIGPLLTLGAATLPHFVNSAPSRENGPGLQTAGDHYNGMLKVEEVVLDGAGKDKFMQATVCEASVATYKLTNMVSFTAFIGFSLHISQARGNPVCV